MVFCSAYFLNGGEIALGKKLFHPFSGSIPRDYLRRIKVSCGFALGNVYSVGEPSGISAVVGYKPIAAFEG